MKKRICYLFVFNGYADWEAALTVATLNKFSDFMIRTFSIDGKTIHSMGDIAIEPDHSMQEVDPRIVDLLILPGGELWENGGNAEIAPLVAEFIRLGKTVAAICGATVLLANEGHLDHIPHTSNGLEYLKDLAPGYHGDVFFENLPCVTGNNVITANGAAFIEFMAAIFRKHEVLEENMLDAVYELYKSAGMDNKLYA